MFCYAPCFFIGSEKFISIFNDINIETEKYLVSILTLM